MTIESILRRKGSDVTTIAPEASIKRAADWLRAKNIGSLVVTSGQTVLGLISEREIVHAFSRYGETAAVRTTHLLKTKFKFSACFMAPPDGCQYGSGFLTVRWSL